MRDPGPRERKHSASCPFVTGGIVSQSSYGNAMVVGYCTGFAAHTLLPPRSAAVLCVYYTVRLPGHYIVLPVDIECYLQLHMHSTTIGMHM